MSGILDSIGGFIDGNKSWLKPVLSLGSNLYKKNQSSNNMSDYIQLMKQQEDQNFANDQAYNSAAQAYNAQVAGASNANRAAAASAAAANQANALAASNKANKQMNKVYDKNKKIYEPYKDTAAALLPQMTKAYTDSLSGYNMLNAYLNTPEQLAKLNSSKPQWATGAPTPRWAK